MASIVIEIPVELKCLAAPFRRVVDLLQRAVSQGAHGPAGEYAAFEVEVGNVLAGVELAAHQRMLSALDVDAPQVVIDGKVFSRVERCAADYYTMAGAVEVVRSLYREVGQRNARVVDPVSLRAGVIGDGWLPHTAQVMAHHLQQGTSREAATTTQLMGRLPYSRSSFERVGHLVGAAFEEHRPTIEVALTETVTVPKEAVAVSVSVDRVSIPMEELRPRPVGRPRKDAPKRPVERVYHMGYCATATLHDANGDALHTIRYGCMPDSDPQRVCESAARDVKTMLRQRPDLRVVHLADGAPEMWNLLETHVGADVLGISEGNVHRLIDFWHVVEKLGKAARAMYSAERATDLMRRWVRMLRNRSAAAEDILIELVVSRKEELLVNGERPVHDAITYLRNNGDRMNFASARRLRLPIGSGNVEATCKSLVQQRMKRAGSRWKHETGQHILSLRALALSDRWRPAMKVTFHQFRHSVQEAA